MYIVHQIWSPRFKKKWLTWSHRIQQSQQHIFLKPDCMVSSSKQSFWQKKSECHNMQTHPFKLCSLGPAKSECSDYFKLSYWILSYQPFVKEGTTNIAILQVVTLWDSDVSFISLLPLSSGHNQPYPIDLFKMSHSITYMWCAMTRGLRFHYSERFSNIECCWNSIWEKSSSIKIMCLFWILKNESTVLEVTRRAAQGQMILLVRK